jgi:hypothetical protein
VLDQTCNIFVAPPGRAGGGGVQFNYSPVPTYENVPCSIQGRATEVFDEQRRITEYTDYIVIFGQYLALSPRDKIEYVDKGGNLRTIFVSADWDMAGRGAAFGVPCTERQ